MNIMSLLSNTNTKKYHILFLKATYFDNELLKNRPKRINEFKENNYFYQLTIKLKL